MHFRGRGTIFTRGYRPQKHAFVDTLFRIITIWAEPIDDLGPGIITENIQVLYN